MDLAKPSPRVKSPKELLPSFAYHSGSSSHPMPYLSNLQQLLTGLALGYSGICSVLPHSRVEPRLTLAPLPSPSRLQSRIPTRSIPRSPRSPAPTRRFCRYTRVASNRSTCCILPSPLRDRDTRSELLLLDGCLYEG